MWLIIILVIVNCTDLFLYFLHLSSNFNQLVLILLHLFNSVPFLMSSFTPFLLSTGLIFVHSYYTQWCLFSAHMVWWFFVKQYIIYNNIIQHPCQLEWETVSWMPLLSKMQTWTWMTWTEDHITCSPRLRQKQTLASTMVAKVSAIWPNAKSFVRRVITCWCPLCVKNIIFMFACAQIVDEQFRFLGHLNYINT